MSDHFRTLDTLEGIMAMHLTLNLAAFLCKSCMWMALNMDLEQTLTKKFIVYFS